MATLQGVQTLQSHCWQSQTSPHLHNLKRSNYHRGENVRHSLVQALLLENRSKRTPSLGAAARATSYGTHSPLHLRGLHVGSQQLWRKEGSSKLCPRYGSQIRGRELRPVCCLPPSQVKQNEVQAESNLSTSTLEADDQTTSKDGTDENIRETQGWAVRRGLNALDAYFSKLHERELIGSTTTEAVRNGVAIGPPSVSVLISESKNERVSAGSQGSGTGRSEEISKDLQGLKALDAYFDKLRPSEMKGVATVSEKMEGESGVEARQIEEISTSEIVEGKECDKEDKIDYRELLEELEAALEQRGESTETSISRDDLPQVPLWGFQAGSSNSYIVNVLVAVNIAVFLFELASPQVTPGLADASLPYLYGAKVNELILDGQWWRLITPMFLHSGALHIGLSTWALLSFGPAVESAYGTLGFGMIYFIGGLFGNLLSFFHTPEGTVGGTGPIYALMGTWLVYLMRNRDIIGLDIADDMIRKVVIMTALNVALCNSLPIDDWTNLGAGFVGVIFGLLTCPLVHFNVHLEEVVPESLSDEKRKSYLLLNEGLHPYRLLLVFALCLAFFFCLYSLGVPMATEFHLLHGSASDDSW